MRGVRYFSMTLCIYVYNASHIRNERNRRHFFPFRSIAEKTLAILKKKSSRRAMKTKFILFALDSLTLAQCVECASSHGQNGFGCVRTDAISDENLVHVTRTINFQPNSVCPNVAFVCLMKGENPVVSGLEKVLLCSALRSIATRVKQE